MARFIAKYAKYRHGVRTGRFMVLEDGQRQELSKELFAKFERTEARPEEVELGVTAFNHRGLPEDRDTNEHVSPRSRISAFDSEVAQERYGWTDEEREIVEHVLRNSPGINMDHMEVVEAKIEKPWPTYDEVPEGKVLEIALSIGYPLDKILKYEEQNGNRKSVVEALQAELAPAEDEAPEVVIQA